MVILLMSKKVVSSIIFHTVPTPLNIARLPSWIRKIKLTEPHNTIPAHHSKVKGKVVPVLK
jgi:hypothetical protein